MKYLFKSLQEDKEIDSPIRQYGIRKLAEEVGIDESYISQCLAGKVMNGANYEKIARIIKAYLLQRNNQ